ncbi:MAG: aldolase [Halobacteriales archaeon SW_9_67_25]|nr:MAG: aldolase [Halobacteriales archaeon SW_9_67_25]
MHTHEAFTREFRQGAPMVGAWQVVGHPVVAELLADAGFDFVVVDGEHSENTLSEIAASVRAIEAGDGAAPLVRVSSADRVEIRRVLDLGPAGVIVPQTESLAEAEEAVRATRYPPAGVRGVAGRRSSGYGRDLTADVRGEDPTALTILQVETAGALEDVEEIAALEGLDGLFVGPADLSARLGAFGEFDAEEFREAVHRVVAAAREADLPVGTIAGTPDAVGRRWDWGVDFIVAGDDLSYVADGATAFRDRFDAL